MNLEELRKRLQEKGVPTGEPWTQTKEGAYKSPLIEKQKETLRKLHALLEKQIEADAEKVADLQVTLQKLKKGGGS